MNPEPALTTRLVDSDSARLYTVACGSGAPLLLVHGWTLDQRSFQPQLESLAANFRVIAFDRRGCGRSTGVPDLSAELTDLDRLIAAFGGGPVHLLGVSQGGRLALRYAATRPNRLRSLVLQGAVLDGYDAIDEEGEAIPLGQYRQWVREGRLQDMRRHWLSHPMMSAGLQDADLRRQLQRIVSDYRGQDLLTPVPAPARDIAEALAGLAIPVLIITGSREVSSRKAHARRLAELIPDAAEVVIDGAGHLSNLSHARQYNELVREFCQRAG